MTQEDIDSELKSKNWEQDADGNYELHVKGFKSYYLIKKDNKWKLKQNGMGAWSIAVYDELNANTLTSIFKKCSDYAKESSF